MALALLDLRRARAADAMRIVFFCHSLISDWNHGRAHFLQAHMDALRSDRDLRAALTRHGLDTIRRRHTCAHRVDQLLAVVAEVQDIRPSAQEAVSL